MSRRNRTPLAERVTRAAEDALTASGAASAIDMLQGIGWLQSSELRRWQLGLRDCLEDAIQISPQRLIEALRLFRRWAEAKGLLAGEAEYVARSTERQQLRCSRDGDPGLEALLRARYVSRTLPEKKRERLAEQGSRPPELVVIQPRNRDWTCHRCGGSGGLLIMQGPGPMCLRCAGLDDLEFLGRGDALLTRRAKAKSARHAVVVRFSRTRKQYERQGLLVEPAALAEAEREVQAQKNRANQSSTAAGASSAR